jgi:hypothetical protein
MSTNSVGTMDFPIGIPACEPKVGFRQKNWQPPLASQLKPSGAGIARGTWWGCATMSEVRACFLLRPTPTGELNQNDRDPSDEVQYAT